MEFVVYSKPECVYCDKAKQLLESHGLQYREVVIDVGQEKQPEVEYITVTALKERIPGVRTVPQIYRGEQLIGGYDALKQVL